MPSYSQQYEHVIEILGVTKTARLIKGRESRKDKSRIYIPQNPTEYLVRILGKKEAAQLCRYYGGTAIRIPLDRIKKIGRDRIILKLHSLKVPVKQIVDYFDMTEQAVYKIIRQAECVNYRA